MADRWAKQRAAGHPLRPADLRQERLYEALSRPRTQAELLDLLGMSNSGILSLLRRMERGGLVSPRRARQPNPHLGCADRSFLSRAQGEAN